MEQNTTHLHELNENDHGVCTVCNDTLCVNENHCCDNDSENVCDGSFMNFVDSEEKAYFLGWVAANKDNFEDGNVVLKIYNRDVDIVHKFLNMFSGNMDLVIESAFTIVTFNLYEISSACVRHLELSDDFNFPSSFPLDLQWGFLRGYFDSRGNITLPESKTGLTCCFDLNSSNIIDGISKFCTQKYTVSDNKFMCFRGNNALDFLGKLYANSHIFSNAKFETYKQWCTFFTPSTSSVNFKWSKTDKDAVKPFKPNVSDSGFDLTIIKELKRNGKVTFYDTCIKVSPEFGWYVDIVPRSSLSKSGYILANSVGIIDRTYTGSIIVALMKIDDDKPELELPFRAVQMIPRQTVHVDLEEVDEIDESARGAGGFGSTG